MSNPLTWRTLAGPQYDPNQTFQNAISNITQLGFGSLNKALTGYQNQQGEIFTEDKAKNQQEAVEALRKYKTPEELQAAIANGAVNQLIAPMGNRVDRSKVIDYADARVKDLRTNITAEQTFKNLQAKQAAASIMDKIVASQNSGDFALADKLKADNIGLLQGFEGALVESGNKAKENNIRLKSLIEQDVTNSLTLPNRRETAVVDTTNTLTAAKNTAKLNEETLQANNLTKDLNLSFKAEEQDRINKVKGLTKAFGLVINPKTGLADYEKSDPEAVIAYAKELKNQKLDVNTASQYYNSARDKLAGLDVSVQEKALGSLGKVLDPEPVLAPKDQAKMDNALANIVAKVDTAKKTNFLYQDPATAADDLTSLLSQAEKDMKGEDLSTLGIRANLAELANKGMEIKIDGVTRVIPLTVKIIKQAYEAGKDPNTFWTPNQTESRIRKHLETVMANPKNIQLFEEAEDLRNEKYKVDARSIKESFYGLSGTVSSAAEASRAADYAKFFGERLRNQNIEVIKKSEAENQDAKNKRLRDELEKQNKVKSQFYTGQFGR